MTMFKRYLNGNLFKFLGIGYLGTFLNMLINVLLIKYLSSYEFGRISLGKSIFQSFEYSHCGLRFGMDRILPHLKSESEKSKYFSAVYYFSIFTSLGFIFYWILYDIQDWLFYLCFSIPGLFYTLITITKIYFRSYENKTKFISISFWIQIFPIFAQILGLLIFGQIGFVLSYIFSYLIVFFLARKYYYVPLVVFNKGLLKPVKNLFNYGGLLFWSSIINFLATTGDRFFIAKYLGLSVVGEFSVIMFFFTAIIMFSSSYTELIMSKIILNPFFSYIIKQITFVIIIAIFLAGISYFVLPFFLELFIPKYSYLVSSIQIILLASIPQACIPILNNFFHAIDKRRTLLIINIISTIVYFVGLIYVLTITKDLKSLVYWKFFSICLLVILTLGSFFYFNKRKINTR